MGSIDFFVEHCVLNNFASFTFSLSIILFKITSKNVPKHEKSAKRGNNSHKGRPSNSGSIDFFVEHCVLNIFASFTFSVSIILFKIMSKNIQKHEKSAKRGNNSHKGGPNNSVSVDVFVER